ncbi:MAG TPA: DUF4301 family protein, partial [Salinimicrobium catena]|nr:DUF4301 family protein [Salinimicrobium catena]
MGFSDKDLVQIEKKGLTPKKVEQQIAIFKRGNVVVNIREAATLRNGILAVSEEEKQELISFYKGQKDKLDLLKFVPASGAATRMFKAFYKFLDEFDPEEENLDDYVERKNDPKLELFFSRMKDLPFYDKVLQILQKKYPDYEELS